MGQIAEIKEQALSLLRGSPGFANWHLVGEFPGTARGLPVQKPTLAVGIDRVEASAGGLGGYLGEADGLSHIGAVAEVTLRFDGWIPRDSRIGGAQALFETLCEALMEGLGAEKIWCEQSGTDDRTLSTHLVAKAALKTCLARSEAAPLMGDIIIRQREK